MIEILKVVEKCKTYSNKGSEESLGGAYRGQDLTKFLPGICQSLKMLYTVHNLLQLVAQLKGILW